MHDTLLVDDPITDEYMYWDVGEVRKDVTSPWTMYVAMCCKITGIAPAVFSHTFFTFYINTYTVGDVFIADLAGKGNRGGIYPSIVNVFVLPDLYE